MAKEIIKDNVVEAPTLFVGVGGTGCKIVQKVAEMCRPGEVENISFVCLDTNVNDLAGVAKSHAKIYYIQTSNTQTVGNYLDYDRDALKNWFPKNSVIYDKTVSEGAGQVRAISRLALNSAIKIGKLRRLHDAVDDLFRKSGKEMKQTMRMVLVSTASGGTGSGLALPLSMYIRDYVNNKYPNTALVARSLILLPETLDSVITSSVERESQRRNAYATVKEINAFMEKASGFCDVVEELKRYKNLHLDLAEPGSDELKSLSLLPFDFCFLLDGQNAEDNTLVSLPQYIEQAAHTLYEQNIGPMQGNAFSEEDNIIKEMSNPGNVGRNRFGGIGASVLRYPYESVVKYVAADWAIDSIGGEGQAAKWSKYDNEYERVHAEEKTKVIPQKDMQTRGDVYVSTLKGNKDKFSEDLKNRFLTDAEKRVTDYIKAVQAQMKGCLRKNNVIANKLGSVNDFAGKIDVESLRGNAEDRLGQLRSYEETIEKDAQKVAERFAESVFITENKTINENNIYSLEFLLKNVAGDICHPNAARYMLYLAERKMEECLEAANAKIVKAKKILLSYHNDASNFQVDFLSETVTSLDELCAFDKSEDDQLSLREKMKGFNDLYSLLNEHFAIYYKNIKTIADNTEELAAYKVGLAYVKELSAMYERFFQTFKSKVIRLRRQQSELVDSLQFTKGDSVYNVCATEAMLKELSARTAKVRDDSGMLSNEMNGAIFDAVKSNVRFEREIRYADVVEEDKHIDIFDGIILGYFQEEVQRDCSSLDMNIVKALEEEKRLKVRIKTREEQGENKENKGPYIDNVSKEDRERYIKAVIAMGERLAAPGIQRTTNEESREINLVAYNKSLDEMREYRLKDMLPKSISTDTVSQYEMHFFNALYNLTPDKLKKFAAPKKTETGSRSAGLYHSAYFDYAKLIGPDSTKNTVISTHIDKRWDSISEMPEMDLDFLSERWMKICKAMVYALVFKKIRYVKLSPQVDGKMLYRYENTDEHSEDMIVSNGTPCDEFYEILDSLCFSSATVEDIELMKARTRQRDEVHHCNYKDTKFAEFVEKFSLEGRGFKPEKATSLFEIPLVYYNSLPNNQRFESEIRMMVEAIISVFAEELNKWENSVDAKFLLCQRLQEQFQLCLDNYKDSEHLRCNVNAKDNPVLDIIYRKIKNVYTTNPEPENYEEMLEALRAKMQ